MKEKHKKVKDINEFFEIDQNQTYFLASQLILKYPEHCLSFALTHDLNKLIFFIGIKFNS